MRIKLYLDEDVPSSFAQTLINRGVDVITTQQAKNDSNSDLQQLILCDKRTKNYFTHNKKDFILLHNEYLQNKEDHTGIIISDQFTHGDSPEKIYETLVFSSAEDMKNRLEFLSNWK